jgi:hypothetical protein
MRHTRFPLSLTERIRVRGKYSVEHAMYRISEETPQ